MEPAPELATAPRSREPRWPSEAAGSTRRRKRWRRRDRGRERLSSPEAEGQPHDDLRSLANGGQDLDAAVVQVDHPPHESEADAGPVSLRGVVHLEDPLDVLRRNAHAGIADGDPERLRFELGTDVDPPSSRHRLTGIDEEVHERPPQHLLVALDGGQI